MRIEEFSTWTEVLAGLATTISIPLAAYALWQSRKQAKSDFENNLTAQYREIVRRIPVEAHLSQRLSEEDLRANLLDFYNYIDLTNEQIFLRQKGRISDETWTIWIDGIQSTLQKPAFVEAWKIIKARTPGSFDELRKLEMSDFNEDPNRW